VGPGGGGEGGRGLKKNKTERRQAAENTWTGGERTATVHLATGNRGKKKRTPIRDDLPLAGKKKSVGGETTTG